jgi:hypothetical protein
MQQSIIGKLWQAFRQGLGRIARAGLLGLALGLALVEGAAAFWNHTAEAAVTLAWPHINVFAPTVFVHVTAIAFGLLLGWLLAFTVAVMQTLRGVFYAAEHVDDVAGAALDKGLDVVDVAVDALDGPDRHGFRGKRGPATVQS